MDEQQRRFERYQMKNLGGFEKLFPLQKVNPPKPAVDDHSDEDELGRQEARYHKHMAKVNEYEEIRALASSLFENQFGVKKSMQPVLQQQTPDKILHTATPTNGQEKAQMMAAANQLMHMAQ